MPILDRSTPPPAQPLAPVRLPAYETRQLSNGLRVYLLPFGSVEVVEVQLVFRAGTSLQPAPGVARYTLRNMVEGTKQRDSLAIAQFLDGEGAWLNQEVDEEAMALKLATTTKQLQKVLPILAELITEPTFPEKEFVQMQRRDLERLAVSEQKTSYIARRQFGHLMFGSQHPYGTNLGREELEALSREQLLAYHRNYLYPGNSYLTVVGQYDEGQVLAQLEEVFGHLPMQAGMTDNSQAEGVIAEAFTGRHAFPMPGLQSTLRLGHSGMARTHPDYYRMTVVNTIFGGYFGSRLMKNIREDKGYTYGIYSAWVAYRHGGMLVIQADAGNEYVEAVVHEVKAEMTRLASDGVDTDELQLVKNYLIGRNLSQRETPFQMSDILRYAHSYQLTFDQLDERFTVIQAMQPDDIAELAQTYLKPDELLEVVAGGGNTAN